MRDDYLPYLLSVLEPAEGCHKVKVDGLVYPYVCPAGYWTQGYGLLCKKNDPPITKEEARARLLARIPYYAGKAFELSPVLIWAPAQLVAAITDFVFNLGEGAYASSTLRRKVNSLDYEAIKRELRRWVNGGGKRLPGLVIRREAECSLIDAALKELRNGSLGASHTIAKAVGRSATLSTPSLA